MKISLFVSLCCSVVFYSSAGQAACVQPPSCEELGFTVDASKCEGSFLKCPWDLTKAACKEKEEVEVGAIVYGDGTVSKDIISGKTPIGVVFDVENHLAMALTDVKKDGSSGSERMNWLINYYSEGYDIPSLDNCTNIASYDLSPITCGVDGRANTDKILACSSSDCGEMQAATAVNRYQPTGCTKDFCKKTKWFLPSLRDSYNIFIAKSQLYTTLILLSSKGAANMSEYCYWSSTEYSTLHAWSFVSDGSRGSSLKCNSCYVRPVIAFNAD